MGNTGRGRTVDDENSQPSDDMIITTPPPPALSDFLPRCIEHWPDIARYAESARIEPLQHDTGWCWGVTVTVFDKEMQ